MTNGTYVGPSAAAAIPEDLVPSANKALAIRHKILKAVESLPSIPKRVFLVGSGGSFAGLVPLQYLMDTESAIPTVRMNSDEFFYRKPPAVNSESLVVALSGAGSTKETVRAATWAEDQGANVLAVTLKEDSLLGTSCKTVLVPEREAGGFRSQLGGLVASQFNLQMIGLALLEREGRETSEESAALDLLPQIVLSSLESFEPKAAQIANAIASQPVTYVLASGPLFGAALTFTMCFMQEMQWMDASTINSNEFFQGPFEVIDKNARPIVFLGEDATRPMAERVKRFLDNYGGDVNYIDALDIRLEGIPERMRSFVMPIIFHALTTRLAAHLSANTGYELDGRRYMWKVEY